MKKKMLLTAAAILLAAGTVCAAEFDFVNSGSIKNSNLKKISSPVPSAVAVGRTETPRAAAKKMAEWTVMVFLNGKNNLEKSTLRDVNEMEMAGSTDKVNIVVELGRMAGYDSSDGDWTGVRRYLIQKDEDPDKIVSPVVQDLGAVDMGDYKTAIDFGRWAKKKYPARKYMFIFWNHGTGWVKAAGLYNSKGISYDDETNNHINTLQMAEVMKSIGGINVLASDACLMQMAEVGFELRNNVPLIVGSEEIEAGDGYTYDVLLGGLINNPSMKAEELAKLAVDSYGDHYDQKGGGYTHSFINSRAMPQFMNLVNAFIAEVMKADDGEAAKYARDNALKFDYAENKDLYDFVSLLVSRSGSQSVKTRGQALMDYITGKLIGYNRSKDEPGNYWSPARELSRAKGIAVYVPNRSVPYSYLEMQWAKKTKWPDFVKWIASKDPPPPGFRP